MPRRFSRALAAALLVAPLAGFDAATASALGEPPVLGVAAPELRSGLALPPLPDDAGGELARHVARLQAGRRAALLHLDGRSATAAWRAADATVEAARQRLARPPPSGARVFAGRRASELNALLRDRSIAAVRVRSPRIDADEPVVVDRAGLHLDLGDAELQAQGVTRFLVRVAHADGATVSGGRFRAGQWGVLVAASRDVTLRDGRYAGLGRGGVVASDAPGLVLAGSRFEQLGGAPVLLHGQTSGAAVLDNRIVGNLGASNWHAGIVVTDRRTAVPGDPTGILSADGHGVLEQRIDSRLRVPRRNVIAFNRIALNASSGLYSDGGSENVVYDNLIEGNAKEGICLDNGSTGNVVAMNVVRRNGRRWGATDEQLRLDFVLPMGRLPDGTSPAKTPGISIDNGLWNVVYANQIDRNEGGGVKMVRTAFFNVVALNVLTDNNMGANPRFHFFAVELGAAPADVPVADLDFTPSRGNLVVGNAIRGNHYAGVFYGPGSTDNRVVENSIFGASTWSQEQVLAQPNDSADNLSDRPSRNMGPALDPALLERAKGRPAP